MKETEAIDYIFWKKSAYETEGTKQLQRESGDQSKNNESIIIVLID